MTTTINGTTGVSLVQDGVVAQADLAANVAGNGPCFSAYASASQSITSGVPAKVSLNTKLFDAGAAFDAVANFRFQPTVAGYYQFVGVVRPTAASGLAVTSASLYKNGAEYARGAEFNFSASFNGSMNTVSELIFLNGTTDYVELYGVVIGTTPSLNAATVAATSRLSGYLARSA